MDYSIKNIENVGVTSNNFENSNKDIKRRYFIRNISTFNSIASSISVSKGSFGTGYPFYALGRDLTGQLPIIQEQIRYNNELINQVRNSSRQNWTCGECLPKNYDHMPDLKQVCKPCPNMDAELKPRKVINRLPDIDMWVICEDGHIEEAQSELTILLKQYNMHTSDVNPLQTFQDMQEITEDIKKGIMPKKFLPIDAHIMEYSKMKSLIERVPSTLEEAKQKDHIPYLPIHPKSYRKTWQYDDTAYNFIYDFLSAFTEFNFESSLEQTLIDTRNAVIKEYSPVELFGFLLQSATEANRKRYRTPELQRKFLERIKSWEIDRASNHEDPDTDAR